MNTTDEQQDEERLVGVDAWLGDARAEMTDEQIDAVRAASERIERALPGPDMYMDREEALITATQVILGETTVEEVAAAEAKARRRYMAARVPTLGALAALEAQGATISAMATRTGLTRPTVYKRLGKTEGC